MKRKVIRLRLIGHASFATHIMKMREEGISQPVRVRADRIRTLEQAVESRSGPYRAGEREFTQEEWLHIQSQGLLNIHVALDSHERKLKELFPPPDPIPEIKIPISFQWGARLPFRPI
ncbi:MAG: hypothetical protein WCH61_03470 [bacterium]